MVDIIVKYIFNMIYGQIAGLKEDAFQGNILNIKTVDQRTIHFKVLQVGEVVVVYPDEFDKKGRCAGLKPVTFELVTIFDK